MAHNHGNEYQIRIVHEDGTEELSGLMNSTEQVAQAMLAVYRPKGKTYWLLVRSILCPNCSEREQIITETPLTHVPSPRFMPHDSGYLKVVESRNRYAAYLWRINNKTDSADDSVQREGTSFPKFTSSAMKCSNP